MTSIEHAHQRPGPTARVQVSEHTGAGTVRRRADRLVTEEPLEIRCSWPGEAPRPVAVTMRTPGHDFELAAGLLFAEGVAAPGTIEAVAYCTQTPRESRQTYNVVTASLTRPPAAALQRRSDTVTAASSACGVCGTESIGVVLARLEADADSPTPGDGAVAAEVVRTLPDRLRESQRVFAKTGGLHAAGLYTAEGEALVVREDIGRHNAVDKVVGSRLLGDDTTAPSVLTVSGRLGYEITQKAVVAAIPVVVAVGAPSSLSVELADRAGTTLIGFADSSRFVVYTHPGRIGV